MFLYLVQPAEAQEKANGQLIGWFFRKPSFSLV